MDILENILNGLVNNIPALITAGIALATFIEARRGNKVKEIVDKAVEPLVKGREENRKGIEELTKTIDSIKGDTIRLQLMDMIRRDPGNVDTILKIAEVYFCELGQNWYCASEFKKWAKAHDVGIPDAILYALKKKHED